MRADEGEPRGSAPEDAVPASSEKPTTDDGTTRTPENAPTADQPTDSHPTRPLDSEETDVLRLDPATTDEAPLSLTKPDTAAPTSDDEPPPFRDPATHQDPHWRPGLLPRDPQGQPVTNTFDTPSAPDDAWPTTPDNRPPLHPPAPTPTTHDSPTPPRRTFDPMSMVAGIFFMGIAVTYLLDAGNAVDARPGIMLALAVIGVGASGFIGAIWATLTRTRHPATHPAKTPPTTD